MYVYVKQRIFHMYMNVLHVNISCDHVSSVPVADPRSAVGSATDSRAKVPGWIPGPAKYFRFHSR